MYRLALIVSALLAAVPLYAGGTLLYMEAQAVGGYSSAEDDWLPYSMHPDDVMQKPSLGFDLTQCFSGAGGDIGLLALQGRIAYDENEDRRAEPQLYNAFIRLKPDIFDIWAGHGRPALGISSYLDSHGVLLPALPMLGFGYDRDWGGGIARQFERGDLALSATTGSGMPLPRGRSFLAAARASYGVLSQDNFNIGASAAYGDVYRTMGYAFMSEETVDFAAGGVDASLFWDRFELRFDAIAGKKDGEWAWASLARLSLKLMDEERLRIELQPARLHDGGMTRALYAGGISFAFTGDLAARMMYAYEETMGDHRVTGQLYYYVKVL